MREAIRKGMALHLATVARRRAAGDQRLGWKIGFKSAEIQQKLGLEGRLCASALLGSSILPEDRALTLDGGIKVGLEAEIGVVLAADISADMSDAAIEASLGEFLPVIEVVDLDRPLDKITPILAHGVFHRGLYLGETLTQAKSSELQGLKLKILLNDIEQANLDVGQATGNIVEILRQAATFLAIYGKKERLRAADLIILGAMGPVIFPNDTDRYVYELDGSVRLRVDLRGSSLGEAALREGGLAKPEKKPSREAQCDLAREISELAQTLTQGKPRVLRTPPFDADLIRDIEQARTFKKDARARQIRRLAALLWHHDRAAIVQAIDEEAGGSSERKARERFYEQWRARLLEEGDAALQEWFTLYPNCDHNQVRNLVRLVSRERNEIKRKSAQTELLRLLREIGERALAGAP